MYAEADTRENADLLAKTLCDLVAKDYGEGAKSSSGVVQHFEKGLVPLDAGALNGSGLRVLIGQ